MYNNVYKIATTAFLVANSSFAGQFFIGASGNLDNNSYQFTQTIKQDKQVIINNPQRDKLFQEHKQLSQLARNLKERYEDFDATTLNPFVKGFKTQLVKDTNLAQSIGDIEYDGKTLSYFLSPSLNTTVLTSVVYGGIHVNLETYINTTQDKITADLMGSNDVNGDKNSRYSILFIISKQHPKILQDKKVMKALDDAYIQALKDFKSNGSINGLDKYTHNYKEYSDMVTEYEKTKKSSEDKYQEWQNTPAEIVQNETVERKITEKVSKISQSLSLLAGYRFNTKDFGFITEVGVDLPFSAAVGEISKGEVRVSKGESFYATQKIGYNFFKNHLSYVTAGASLSSFTPKYKGQIKEDKMSFITPVIGIGDEFVLQKNLSLFFEFNIHFKAKFDIKDKADNTLGEMEVMTQQIKAGLRYYL
jgi:hypothetical protein